MLLLAIRHTPNTQPIKKFLFEIADVTTYNLLMNTQPHTDEEWIIHSINIHGFFFERLCEEVISKSEGWRVKETNYPVEFPILERPAHGKESKLDIYAEFNNGERAIALLIECKKNNPDFINWIFFPKPQERRRPNFPRTAKFTNNLEEKINWRFWRGLVPFPSEELFQKSLIIAEEAREVRGSYQHNQRPDKTKTSNTAVTDASNQIALATQAIIVEESEYYKELGVDTKPRPLPFKEKIFIPSIVTTAKIFCCSFKTEDIDPATGEVNIKKAELTECTHLVFEYALPRSLQHRPPNIIETMSRNMLEAYIRMPILVIHSPALPEILSTIAQSISLTDLAK
jgi:hypothetical protein